MNQGWRKYKFANGTHKRRIVALWRTWLRRYERLHRQAIRARGKLGPSARKARQQAYKAVTYASCARQMYKLMEDMGVLTWEDVRRRNRARRKK